MFNLDRSFNDKNNVVLDVVNNNQAKICQAINNGVDKFTANNIDITINNGNNIKTNDDSEGFNTKIALLSRIMDFHIKKFESKFFPEKSKGVPVTIDDLVTTKMNDKPGSIAFGLDEVYIKLDVNDALFSNKRQIENTLSYRPGQTAFPAQEEAFNLSYARKPHFKRVKNLMTIIPYCINDIENISYTGLLNDNLNTKVMDGLHEALHVNTGEYYKKLLIGNNLYKGLFNQPSIYQLSAEEATSLMQGTKSLDELFISSGDTITKFVQAIKLIVCGMKPAGFTSIPDGVLNHVGFQDPVLLVPTSVYIALHDVKVLSKENGGVVQYRDKTQELIANIGGYQLTILPMSVTDSIMTKSNEMKQWSVCPDDNTDVYMLYDKSSIYRLITTKMSELFSSIKANMGIETHGCFVGSVAELISPVMYNGIKWTVRRQ